jgi:hypothetical protein
LDQVVFPNLYDQAKSFQRLLLHGSVPLTDGASEALGPVFASAPAAARISSLTCSNPVHPIAFTTDMWSGPDHESYICLTAHWIDKNWILNHALLDIYVCTDRHTGDNIADWLKQIWADNEISVCLLSDCALSALLVFCCWHLFWASDSTYLPLLTIMVLM